MATVTVNSNRVFAPVHQAKHRYVAMKGSAGSGKSVDTAQQYVVRLLTQPGRNLLCVRKSEVTNRDSTFAELAGAISRIGVSSSFSINISPLEIRCVNGNKIIFRGMNDAKQREKIKSITFAEGDLTDIWMEEATEFTQADFEILDDRLRGKLSPELFYQIKLTFNPVAATHWIKGAFFDIDSEDVLAHHSTYLDNRFIDAAYHKRMERRKQLDPEGYKVYGLGEWGEVGGQVLTNYHIGDYSTDVSMYDSVSLGQDFGFNHANAILLLGFKDDNVYVLDEIYKYELDTTEIIQLTKDKPDWRHIIMYCDCAEPDRIKEWQKAGYRAKPVKKGVNSENQHIDWLKGRKIFIDTRCTNTIKEIQQWKWQYDERRSVWLDKPVNFMDDAMAALRYGTQPWRKHSGGRMINVK